MCAHDRHVLYQFALNVHVKNLNNDNGYHRYADPQMHLSVTVTGCLDCVHSLPSSRLDNETHGTYLDIARTTAGQYITESSRRVYLILKL